jgi:hypothetical protein
MLNVVFFTDRTANQNGLNTGHNGETSIIQTICTIDCFRGKLTLWKTHLLKSEIIYFTSVRSLGDVTFFAPVYNPCTESMKERFEDFKRMEFPASCSTNPFQDRDVSHGSELISSVSKKCERNR